MKKIPSIFLVAVIALSWACAADAAKVRFKFNAWSGPEIVVHLARPVGLTPDRPVVFVMHGNNRNADEYRDQWQDLAKEHEFLLVVPEFSDVNFPGAEAYNLGNVTDREGKPVKQSEWSFTAIERIFDEVRRRFSVSTESYSLYGHSAGAQFVHRFIFHTPGARVSRVVAANAGWYTMPDREIAFPYGLQDSAVSEEMLAAAFEVSMTLLLGSKDNDPLHLSLRRSPEAMKQGEHRLARGHSFFEAAQARAKHSGLPFNWQLATVPGADHDNRLMAPAAVPYLLAE